MVHIAFSDWLCKETDSFAFIATDGTAASDPATVTITVTPVPDEPNVTITSPTPSNAFYRDETVTLTWNANDPDGDTITCEIDYGDNSPPLTIDPCPAGESTQTHTYRALGTHTVKVTVSDGTTPCTRSVDVQITTRTFTSIQGGAFHAVAYDTDGNAWAWGANDYGQLGNNTTMVSNGPVAVSMPEGSTFTTNEVGDLHSVTLDRRGNAWAWGNNLYGQLGDGTLTNRNAPVAVTMP